MLLFTRTPPTAATIHMTTEYMILQLIYDDRIVIWWRPEHSNLLPDYSQNAGVMHY